MTMEDIDSIGQRFNTDKAARFVNKTGAPQDGNNYLRNYDFFLKDIRDDPVTLLEIGVGPEWNCGKSIKTWLTYFRHPAARVIGVDISAHANQDFGGRASIHIGDATSAEFIVPIVKEAHPHVLIDDGSHLWTHQISAFELLFPFVRDGGLYIIEDIGTSFGSQRKSYNGGATRDAFSYVVSKIAILCGLGGEHPLVEQLGSDDRFVEHIEYVCCCRQTVIIRKR